MADVHDKATRSKNMRAIATRDTAIEKRIAALLTGAGFTFVAQDRALPGRPDFALPDYRCVIFTHGCFWHHHDCYLFKVPATRTAFWLDKIAGNVARDARDRQQLAEQGWRIDCLGVRVTWAREADGCGAYRASGRVDLRRRARRADRYAGDPRAGVYFAALQGVASLRAGKRYFPSVTSTTAKIITASASHSMSDRLSPPNPVPSKTATTGLT